MNPTPKSGSSSHSIICLSIASISNGLKEGGEGTSAPWQYALRKKFTKADSWPLRAQIPPRKAIQVMVFPIRRLIFRSKVPNYRLTFRATSLHRTSPSFSAAPRPWQHRSFTALSRYNQEKDDKSTKKDTSVKSVEEAIESTQESDSAEVETVVKSVPVEAEVTIQAESPSEDVTVKTESGPTENVPGTTDDGSAEESIAVQPSDGTINSGKETVPSELEDASIEDSSPENDEKVRQWQKEIEITDEELAYFMNTYPDITPELITEIKLGKLSESDLIDMLEDDVKEQEEDLTEDQRKQLAKLDGDLQSVGQNLFSGKEAASSEFDENELAEFGLTKEDIHALEEGDASKMDPGMAMRVKNAMLKMGMTEDEFREMMEEDDEDDDMEEDEEQEEDDEDEDEEDRALSKSFNAQFGLKGNKLPSEEELDAFLRYAEADMEIPDDLKATFKKAMQGDGSAMEEMLGSLSKEDIEDLVEGDVDEEDQLARDGEDGEDNKRGREVDGQKQPQNKAEIMEKLNQLYMEKFAETSGLTDDFVGDKGFADWMKNLENMGIDPMKMEMDEFIQAFEAQTEKNSWTKTEDGDIIRVHHVSTPEQLANVRQELKSSEEQDNKVLAPPRRKTKYEKMAESLEVPEREPGESAEAFEDRSSGFLTGEELEEKMKEKEEPGFFNYGEEGEDVGEDEEFQGDDLSAAGHSELEQHRELREYARLAAWELPLLHSMLHYSYLLQNL